MPNAVWMLLLAAAPIVAQDGVKFDTPEVRVIEAVNTPGQRSALHKHDVNRVMIYLDDGHMELTDPQGNVENVRWKAGDVRWSPAGGPHTSANVGSTTYRIISDRLGSVRQFGTIVEDIKRPRRFCNAVDKNGGGIIDATKHLLCYKVRSPAGPPTRSTVFILNQFGNDSFTLFGTRELCVPTEVIP